MTRGVYGYLITGTPMAHYEALVQEKGQRKDWLI